MYIIICILSVEHVYENCEANENKIHEPEIGLTVELSERTLYVWIYFTYDIVVQNEEQNWTENCDHRSNCVTITE